MRGNSLSFFKPPVFGKTVLIFCALFSALLFNSCKQLASFDPGVEGARIVVNNTLSAPTGIVATHGLKRKISLQWIPVSGATYYDIYCADSATAEFKKIGETVKNSFDDNVSAGKTLYYKVCAVKSRGAQSPFSVITKGTSLAQPIISGGEADDSSVTISWFMENARGIDGIDNYEDMLKFEVCYQPKSGGEERAEVIAATDFFGSSYEYTFTNLAGSSEYQFYVKAYLSSDQQSFEQSSKVDKETLTSYVPLAPEFIASQGESAKGIWLFITLPEKVMVSTVTKTSPDEKTDEPYPLCFEISRKSEGGNYEKVETLYYNGTTTPPNATDYLDSEKGYIAGTEIRWFDESANVQGGVKYTYRIRSFVDVGYSTVVCPEGKEYDVVVGTPEDKASESEGWKSAHPVFKVTYPEGGGKTIAGDPPKVCLVDFGFHAEWNDLGVADKYKFAMKQNRKLLGADSSASGTDTWLTNKNDGSCFFTTLDEINEYAVAFGSKENGLSEDDKGIYSYTLYIIPKSETAVTDDESIVLDSTKAIDEIQVTPDAELPEAKLTVKDGYKDKVVLTIAIEKPGEKYKVVRTRLENGRPIEDSRSEFVLNIPDAANVEKGTFEYEDTDVQSNCTYSYILKAEATSGAYSSSLSQEAETLGTPTVSFEREKLSYDSITISFGGVLAAEKYVVQLGAAGSFGDGETFAITKDEDGEWKTGENAVTGSQGASADVTFSANKFTVTMKKPHGYDDATLAGIAADATVTAHSAVDNATSAAVAVNVVGPALLKTEVNTASEAKEDSISLSWNRVDGAKGYLIRRVMYDDVGMTSVAEDSGVTYYYDVSSGKVTLQENEAVGDRVTVEPKGDGFRLTDTYKETDVDATEYQEAQAKMAWGLPFRYIVLPVLGKSDFAFESRSLALEKGVAYNKLEEKETVPVATIGYGLNVDAAKSESATSQNVKWEAPFYGSDFTPRVYRRKFAERNTNNWELVDSAIRNCEINYSPSGKDRYCAWEYVVKYESGTSSGTIAPSYVEWMGDSAHDETDYDYGSKPKEKRNKGYLLAMDFDAKYGGTGTSKGDADYYSEDVAITPWDDADRTLEPSKVELQVLSLDLAKGWQTVGALDPEITTFTEKGTLDDTIVEDVKYQTVKLKPQGIANGTSGTTSGPLKILRSAKHYYGLKISCGEHEDFDCKNYEEYAYRQITDEELIKSTMLVVASLLQETKMTGSAYSTAGVDAQNSLSTTYTGYDGKTTFLWGNGSNSKLYWQLAELPWGWDNLPCGEELYKKTSNYYPSTGRIRHFLTIADRDALTSSQLRGYKLSKAIKVLGTSTSFSDNKNYIPITVKFETEMQDMIQINSAIVYFTGDLDNGKFWSYVNDNNANPFSTNNNNDQRKWIPITGTGNVFSSKTDFYCKDPAYGWWDN